MERNNLEFYDASADVWWEEESKIYALYHLNKPRFEFFDRYVSNWQSLKVLDVGCGGGYSCEFMAERGAIVSGIDRSAKCIAAAREHSLKRGIEIDYRCETSENIPYEDNLFDAVICVDVLEHVADLNKTISEIHRVLKPKGTFLFDTINRNFKSKLVMIWLLEDILQQIPRGIHDWRKFIKPEELKELLKNQGFENTIVQGFDMFSKPFKNYKMYREKGVFEVEINNDTSIMYIGKAVKVF